MLKIMLLAAVLGAASVTLCQADPAPNLGGSAGTSGLQKPPPQTIQVPMSKPVAKAPDAQTPPIHEIQQPSVIPITLSPAEISMIVTYLQQQPYTLAAPLMQFFSQKENEAQVAARGGKK